MNIITKREAMAIQMDSLFTPVNGGTLDTGKFDNGKYEWKGSANAYLGKECQDIKGVHAVYVERRVDSDGPYAQIMCIYEN